MTSIEEAKTIINTHTNPLEKIRLDSSNALGYVLAQDILSTLNLPSFNQSAMDGYALNFSESEETEFNLVGEIKTGDSHTHFLQSGECFRIFTGAMIPEKTSAVVMQEKVTVGGNKIKIESLPQLNQNIRPISEQIEKGKQALQKGTLLNAAAIGYLSALGVSEVEVYKKPSISIIVTGNELTKPTEKLEAGKIYESNSQMLSAALQTCGYESKQTVWVKDDQNSTIDALELASKESDVVLISGGISVGDHDYVESALNKIGVETLFYKVNQKPGKPLYFGKNEKSLFFALPGNPSAALICYYNYVLLALKKMSGNLNNTLEKRELISQTTYTKKGSRPQFLKARTEGDTIHILEGQSSAMLHTFALSNALVFLDEEVKQVQKGEKLITYILP